MGSETSHRLPHVRLSVVGRIVGLSNIRSSFTSLSKHLFDSCLLIIYFLIPCFNLKIYNYYLIFFPQWKCYYPGNPHNVRFLDGCSVGWLVGRLSQFLKGWKVTLPCFYRFKI